MSLKFPSPARVCAQGVHASAWTPQHCTSLALPRLSSTCEIQLKSTPIGAKTLERVDSSKPTSQLEFDYHGGGTKDGNRNGNGGGGKGRGDDHPDEDDYLGRDDGDDDLGFPGPFSLRTPYEEEFGRSFVEAVLREWLQTLGDLPAAFQQAYDFGILSTEQLVRFLSICSRPSVTRDLYRMLPSQWLPRLLADPSLHYKLAVEQVVAIGYGVFLEIKQRGNRIKDEWHLAACNVLTLTASNLVLAWSLAPVRTYDYSRPSNAIQATIRKLPSNVFHKNFKHAHYCMQQRLASFFYKTALFATLGAFLGASKAGISHALQKNEGCASLKDVQSGAAGYAAFLGLWGNLRYQLVYGSERLLQDRMNNVGMVLLCSTVLRLLCIVPSMSPQPTQGAPVTHRRRSIDRLPIL